MKSLHFFFEFDVYSYGFFCDIVYIYKYYIFRQLSFADGNFLHMFHNNDKISRIVSPVTRNRCK